MQCPLPKFHSLKWPEEYVAARSEFGWPSAYGLHLTLEMGMGVSRMSSFSRQTVMFPLFGLKTLIWPEQRPATEKRVGRFC